MTMVRLRSMLGCALALTLFLPLASHPLARSEASWERLGFAGSEVQSIALDASRPNILLTVVGKPPGYRVYRSGDRGLTWDELTDLSGAVRLVSAGRGLYYSAGSGIYRSTDGLSWTRVYTATQVREGVMALRVSRSNPQVAYALTHVTGGFATGLIRTSDGGDIWVPRNLPVGNAGSLDLDVDAWTPNRVYLAGAYGNFSAQWVSDDGGFRWEGDGVGGPGDAVAVRADATLSGTYYVAAGCLYRISKGVFANLSPTVDGRCKSDNRGHHGLASSRAVAGALFAYQGLGGEQVDWTVDRGGHWLSLGTPNPNLYITTLEVDEENPQNLYLGTTDGLWRAHLPRYYFPVVAREWAGGW